MSDPQNPEAAKPAGPAGDLDADVAIEEPGGVSPAKGTAADDARATAGGPGDGAPAKGDGADVPPPSRWHTMLHQIATRTKERRRHRLMERQREISWAYQQTLIGQQLRVLVDGFSEAEQMWEGRYEGQAPEIDGVVYIQGERLTPGTFVQVEVTEATEYDLIGRPLALTQGCAE